MPRVLLLDNRDSFVWNLAQALGVLGASTDVVRSDSLTVADVRAFRPDAVLLSPGPGHPETAGICIEVVRALHETVPILGVCLGHQAIGAAFGGTIRRAPPCHGKAWRIEHEGQGLFEGLPNPLEACRYHSLVVDLDTSSGAQATSPLVVDARTPEGEIMGFHHRSAPTFGVQFHPESFRSPLGPAILERFLAKVPVAS